MLLVADVAAKHRIAMTAASNALFGIDAAQRAAIVDPGRDSRRLLGPHADRPSRHQPALSRTSRARSRQLTGCPVVVNTSFNVRGEPIVCTPEDAFRCFMGTDIDVLAVGNRLLRKEDQEPALATRYERTFEPD